MSENFGTKDGCSIVQIEKPDSCDLHSGKNEQTKTDNILSKRQMKKIKKREKWLKSKPEKR